MKIVALTASAFVQQREEVLGAGMDDFLRKPYRREAIFDCMERHLGVLYSYRTIPLTHTPDPVAIRLGELAKLPSQLRKELADAVTTLDPGAIGRVIHRIAEHDAVLGEALAHAAKRSAYTAILKALAECDAPS